VVLKIQRLSFKKETHQPLREGEFPEGVQNNALNNIIPVRDDISQPTRDRGLLLNSKI
jgi:hypothetical protein